ncbi:hypothetical protein F4781DRAFT_73292 [Annulohypoxylon bovei var. microspora]|nr:hypothetical protein F4781DRAFT_73292 [Annulohypoxylon bovei var. microspora]
MADPVSIAGTTSGIVSLCLQVYGSLSSYLNDFKDRDPYVNRITTYLDRLRDSVRIIESVIPAFQNEYSNQSQTVVLCLRDCEAELRILDTEVQKYRPACITDLKGKLKETKKRFQFPFGRPELEKLAFHLDRINSLLSVAIQGLDLHVQSTNRDKLMELGISNRAAVTELATVHTKIDEIHSKGDIHEVDLKGNQAAISAISQKLSLVDAEIRSSAPQMSQIQTDASYSVTLLHKLTASYQQSNSKSGEIIELLKAISQANQTSPGERFFHMLMSKPDFLRSCQDELATICPEPARSTSEPGYPGIIKRQGRVLSSCECRHRRQITRQFSRWLFLTRFDESITDLHHEPGCPKYGNAQTRQRQASGIIYTGLRRILKIAVEASVVWNTGAGGTSFAPTFRYYAMVDGSQSPAFLIVSTMVNAVVDVNICRPHPDKEIAYEQLIHIGVSKLRRIFASGSSSVTDVNERGLTLIEEFSFHTFVAHVLEERYYWSWTPFHAILLELLGLDVPCISETSVNSHSTFYSCNNMSCRSRDVEYIKKRIAPLLVQNQPTDYLREKGWDFLSYEDCRNYLFEIEGVAEAFGLDTPLFTALLQKDEILLKSVLPTLSMSPNLLICNGLPALHVAIFWPKGLGMLLDSQLDIDLNIECNGLTPLELAMLTSKQICREGGERLCKDCPCAESTKVLLDFRCRLTESHLQSIDEYSTAVNYNLLGHVKVWRERLMNLAKRELRMDEKRHIGLCDLFVLDQTAPEVIRTLETRGIFSYRVFQLDQGDYRLSPPSDIPSSSSIYHRIRSTHTAEIAWEVGFRDIDLKHGGISPVMYPGVRLDCCEWYLAHGANAMNLVPFQCCQLHSRDNMNIFDPANSMQQSHTVAHHLMKRAGEEWARKSYLPDKPPCFMTSLISRVGTSQIGDGCECGCSDPEEGCFPLKLFFGGILSGLKNMGLDSLFAIVGGLEEIIDLVSPPIANAIIRALTFEVLDIRHTCCETIPQIWDCRAYCNKDVKSYGEDFSYIRDEDASLLDELESLMTEFTDAFQSQEHPFSNFLEGYWKERMDQIREEKKNRRLTPEEKEAAEKLGVRLVDENPEDSKVEESSISMVIDRRLRELDSIREERLC